MAGETETTRRTPASPATHDPLAAWWAVAGVVLLLTNAAVRLGARGVETIRAGLPGVPIAWSSITPGPGRWEQREQRQAANALVEAWIATHGHHHARTWLNMSRPVDPARRSVPGCFRRKRRRARGRCVRALFVGGNAWRRERR